MDQQLFWNDLRNPVDSQNLPDPPVFPSDTNMSCANLAAEGSADLSMWSSGGSSSTRHPVSRSNPEETKVELGWASSLTINGGQGSGTEERQLEATNIVLGLRTEDYRLEANNLLAMEDVNLNLNSNQVDNNQTFLQNPGAENFIKTSDNNASHDATLSWPVEPEKPLHLNSSGSLGSLQVSSSGGSLNLRGSSSSGIGFLTENFEDRPGTLLDGQRMACKRKSIEGVSAQSSAGGSSNSFYQSENSLVQSARHNADTALCISSSSSYPSGINPPGEQLNPRISTSARLGAYDCHPFSVAANRESTQRNRRVRMNPPQPGAAPPSSWVPSNSLLPSDPWSTHLPSSLLIPFTQALDSGVVVAAGTSEIQPSVLPFSGLVPNMQPFSWNGASSSRISVRSPAIAGQRTGSSSSTRAPDVAVQRTGSSTRAPAMTAQRSIALRDESSSVSTSRTNVSENLVFVPATDINNPVQDLTSWGLANGSTATGHVAPLSRSVTTSQLHQLAGPTWIPHQNAASHYHRGLTEVVRRSLTPGGSGSGQSVRLSQRTANSNTSQEIARQGSSAVRAHQHPYARSALLMDRHSDGLVGIPLRSLAAAREGRSRVLSEQIRNAMQLVRRGENLHLEDILLFDHSVFFGGAANLHDRHRDLRLDVDNMSYEELLALEERIGNVSTGLSEETVLKYLKQWKYICLSEETDKEVEPCCVCQEEYMEGEEMARLDCGHDFHTTCIKQWLMQKNLCPICKTPGLDTEKHKKEAHCLT
ncbi:putative E3 ubiquitin-protein ligase HIP1 isoform X1 [Iris pallida]|uniref:RING-type E3 ubiquitin transferase n=1 Tax=Iris pallida TaxID=29817 RepID=A0AAX6EUT2_IRIPA|nr:putative E3 ubiquitin-protein ligase HIP1 isoform X1 [Iris pallida]